MKRLLGIFLFGILGVNFAFSQEITPSKISKVTLFTNQALVVREAKVKVKPGLNRIFLEIKAFSLDRDSLQAKVFGGGEIFSVQFKQIPLKRAPQENIRDLEEKIKELKDQKEVLQDSIKILDKKEEFLNSLVDFSGVEIPKELKTNFPQTSDLEKTLSFLDKNLSEINKNREKLNLKIRQVNEDIEVKEKELASLKRPEQKTKKVIEVLFNSEKEQEIKIQASYLAYNASWASFYKVNVPLDLKEVDLTMFSKIKQKTGEDWRKISLNISNVIPLKGVRLPTLNSWWLDVQRSFGGRRFRGGFELSDKSVATRAPLLKMQEEAKFAQAERKKLPLSFEYELPQILTIESQDKETILPLFSKTLKGEFFYYAVPKMSPLTFLVCKAKADKELLAGYLNVYFGGRFVGKTYLEEKKPGEEFKVSLGADREVKVKREKIKDKIKETFFGKLQRKTIIRDLVYKITVENLKDREIDIHILDNIPVSKTDKIKVKNLKISPSPKQKNYQDKEGLNLWNFKLKPGQKKEINIEFRVTYSKDTPIIGL